MLETQLRQTLALNYSVAPCLTTLDSSYCARYLNASTQHALQHMEQHSWLTVSAQQLMLPCCSLAGVLGVLACYCVMRLGVAVAHSTVECTCMTCRCDQAGAGGAVVEQDCCCVLLCCSDGNTQGEALVRGHRCVVLVLSVCVPRAQHSCCILQARPAVSNFNAAAVALFACIQWGSPHPSPVYNSAIWLSPQLPWHEQPPVPCCKQGQPAHMCRSMTTGG
jgi:hypothetical protein